MSTTCRVAIIGAGPYGLALAAHLRAAGLSCRVFGETMLFWRNNMPSGMVLRSEWPGSHIADPDHALTLDRYEADQGIRLSRRVPLEDFVEYGLWFQRRAIPDVDTRRIELVERAGSGFKLTLSDGEVASAERVVLAIGLKPFAIRPSAFDSVPEAL